MNASFLRWAGSKKQLIPILISFWNSDFLRYVEPFAGSAVLFFNIAPSTAIISDINPELVATYCEIRNNLPSVLEKLHQMKIGKQYFLEIRSQKPDSLSKPDRAARFIYLNRFCFNGLYRTNKKGEFNVPYGGDSGKGGRLPQDDLLVSCQKKLLNAEINNLDFESTLDRTKEGDFVYIDPPFSIRNQRIFTEYDSSIFGAESVKKLREWMFELDHRKVKFLISYAESQEADMLKTGFNYEIVSVHRNIAGFSSKRKSENEVLIYN